MSADNYKEILEEVVEKLSNLDNVKEMDILNIKESLSTLENLMTDTQAKLNFQDIKEKLENLSFQMDNCNETLLKDLYNDINDLKQSSSNVSQYIENLQNVQNLALTSAEFEEYQKQQLDLALKTNENIVNELNALKENAVTATGEGVNKESIKQIEALLENLHQDLTGYIKQITDKLSETPNIDDIGGILSDLNSVNQKNIKETNSLIKGLQNKFDKFQNTEFENQMAKIAEIYDSLGIIHAWIEKVGFLNKSIENVYSRLGANIDFDDVADKIDILYENVTSLNDWTQKIDSVDSSMSDIQSKIAALSDFMDDSKNISKIIRALKDNFDNVFSSNPDFEDLSNKMDIVYENLSTINEWTAKVDKIDEKIDSLSSINEVTAKVDEIDEKIDFLSPINEVTAKVDEIDEKIDSLHKSFYEEMIASKVDVIYENITLLNDWANKINNLSDQSKKLDNKLTQTNDNLNLKIDEINEKLSKATETINSIPDLKDKLEDLSWELNTLMHSTKEDTDSYLYTLLDIESDFIKLNKVLDDNTKSTSADILSIKEKFEELNEDISSISVRTNKLILSADDANKEFKTYLDSFKNVIQELETQRKEFNPELKFNLLGTRLTELVNLMQKNLEANKNINNAFIYLAEWIDATGSALNAMSENIEQIKKEANHNEIIETAKNNAESIISEIKDVKETVDNAQNNIIENIKSETANTNENIARIESILTENIKSDMVDSIKRHKQLESLICENIKSEIGASVSKIENLENVINAVKNEDISEIKSLLTGVMVQLNTALTPDIDSLNERIDKLTEENNNKYTALEEMLQKKVSMQAKQINSLETKINDMSAKFDKLVEVMSEDKSYEIKDILNYIAAQTAAANETLQNQQNTSAVVNEVAQKLSSFDTNLNKIVSYIEEE